MQKTEATSVFKLHRTKKKKHLYILYIKVYHSLFHKITLKFADCDMRNYKSVNSKSTDGVGCYVVSVIPVHNSILRRPDETSFFELKLRQ